MSWVSDWGYLQPSHNCCLNNKKGTFWGKWLKLIVVTANIKDKFEATDWLSLGALHW